MTVSTLKGLKRKRFRRRVAFEPVIGHLKQYLRMGQNYLSGDNLPKIKALLAAAAWNFKKLIEELILKIKNYLFSISQQLFFFEFQKIKTSF